MSLRYTINNLESILLFTQESGNPKEIQAELQYHEVKMQKPSDTRWFARGRAVRAVG